MGFQRGGGRGGFRGGRGGTFYALGQEKFGLLSCCTYGWITFYFQEFIIPCKDCYIMGNIFDIQFSGDRGGRGGGRGGYQNRSYDTGPPEKVVG